MLQKFKQVLNGKYLKKAISLLQLLKFKKAKYLYLFDYRPLAEIWPFSDGNYQKVQKSEQNALNLEQFTINRSETKDYFQNGFYLTPQ